MCLWKDGVLASLALRLSKTRGCHRMDSARDLAADLPQKDLPSQHWQLI